MTFCRPPSSTPTSVRCRSRAYATVTRRRQLPKQDCEITAGYRMLARLRADYPRMAAVADSLYSKQPFVEQVTAKRFSFLLVAQPGDHKSLYQDLAVLRRDLLDRHTTEHRQERREYEWITDLPLNANPITAHQLHPCASLGHRPDPHLRQHRLVRAARARWKIENEGLPSWSTISATATSTVRGVLRTQLLAFFIHRSSNWWMACTSASAPSSVPGARSGTRCAPPSGCFCSWDQVLVRMNSPPQPLPPYQDR